jgi:hypothetical protein
MTQSLFVPSKVDTLPSMISVYGKVNAHQNCGSESSGCIVYTLTGDKPFGQRIGFLCCFNFLLHTLFLGLSQCQCRVRGNYKRKMRTGSVLVAF